VARKRRHYILTVTAERDFQEARQWSLSRWAKDLTKQYFIDLHESVESIARNHKGLAAMEHLAGASGLSIHPLREHYLVYVPITDNYIVIVSLIRQTRDVPAILAASGYRIRRQLKEIVGKLEQGAIPNLKK